MAKATSIDALMDMHESVISELDGVIVKLTRLWPATGRWSIP